MPCPLGAGMKRHAFRTAMALYDGGTLDLETAARQAGVSPNRLQRAVLRAGGSAPAQSVDSDRVTVGAD